MNWSEGEQSLKAQVVKRHCESKERAVIASNKSG